jgi:hypothetical protein
MRTAKSSLAAAAETSLARLDRSRYRCEVPSEIRGPRPKPSC